MSDPAVKVLPYQQRWIDDEDRFAIALKARQIGWTWCTMLSLVIRCAFRRQKWYYLSLNEQRAEEAIEYGVMHSRAMSLACEMVKSEPIFEGMRYKQLAIEFPNGSKIIGLTSNPVTARGCSGNIVLDEFAHHLDSEKIYQALYPVVTRGYKLRILSTPNGKQGKFYDIWEFGQGWSKHEVNIFRAVDEGLEVDVESIRVGCGCEDDWLQEYCCAFLDEAKAWLPYSLIDAAFHPDATEELDLQVFKPKGPCFLGVDIARKRDLTVLWLMEQINGRYWTRMVQTMQREAFSKQREAIDAVMPIVRRAGIDATGVGAQLAEELVERWGEAIIPVVFSGQKPAMVATQVKAAFEDRNIFIPKDAEIRKDLHQVRRTYTEAGNVRFEAPRTKDGHADRFWACGLGLFAADGAPLPFDYQGLPGRDWGDSGGCRNWDNF